MHKSHGDRLRQAVAEALRSADIAHTATHRAKRKMDNLLSVSNDLQNGTMTATTIQKFVDEEVKRQYQLGYSLECNAWTMMSNLGDLAELIGAKRKPR
jgi:hypothetical protein